MGFVQATNNFNTSGSATSITTTGITTTSGNQVYIGTVVWQTGSTPADAATPITDSKGNTWVKVGSLTDAGGDRVSLWYCANIVGGSGHTFTYSVVAGAYETIAVMEFSGAATSSPLDQGSNSTFAAGTTSSTTSPSITTTNAADFLIAVGGGGTGGSADTFSSGSATWTTPAATQQSNSAGELIAMGYAVVSSTGTYSVTFTNSAGGNIAVGIAAFKQAGGSAPQPYPFRKTFPRFQEWNGDWAI